MATQMQLRGGTTAENLLFTGAQRELTVDTDLNTVYVHDGVTAGGFRLASSGDVDDGTFYYNEDAGSAANAYILTPKANTNVPSSYLGGVQFGFVSTAANTGPSTANFQGLGVKNLKYPGGVDPLPGDIFGRVYLIYDEVNGWLEIQRKSLGPPPQLRSIGATVATNAMTLTLNPCFIDFRSASLTSGAVVTRSVTSAITLIIPAGATLGTISAIQNRLAVIAIDNAGVVELAVINLAGASTLDEGTVISTTAITAGSSSATTFYSTVARANVAYRVVGFVASTQATAGTWGSSPSQIQGQGGQNQIGSHLGTGGFIATTAGTSIDFTGLPPYIRRITLSFNGVSTNGTSGVQVQLGTSGGVVASGYVGTTDSQSTGGGSTTSVTTGLGIGRDSDATYVRSGICTFVNVSGGTWVGTWLGVTTGAVNQVTFGGTSVTLTGVLDRLRLTTAGGANTFDAGTISIIYES